MRPQSIRLFGLLYLIAVLGGLVTAWLGFAANAAVIERDPMLEGVGGPIVAGATLFMLALQLLGWWLVTKRANVAGKWIVTVLLLLTVVGWAGLLLDGLPVLDFATILNLVMPVVEAVAVAQLFRADASDWLAARGAGGAAGTAAPFE